ncbi:glycosyltransferase family 9 protein [Tenacibaculum sp.]|nr:glycosyltransferase family 9 protein [Tenacibaculum sp.]
MNPKNLIIIDRLARPLYLILKTLSIKKGINSGNQNFIILKFFGFGSITRIVHVLDTIGIARNRVTFITLEQNKVLIDLLNLNAVYIKTNTPITLITSLLKLTNQIWRTKKSTILDMERVSNLSGIFRLIIGIKKPCSSFYFKPKNSSKKGHTFISLLNKPATAAIAEMFNKQYRKPLYNNINKTISNKIFININAGTYFPQRKFTLSKYSKLIKELHFKNPNWHFYLTGTSSEHKYVELFKQRLINHKIPTTILFNIAGKYNLSEFVNNLKEAKLLITNDSGPLHLANFFKVKTVGIWGPTSSALIGYENSSQMFNLDLNLECSPCFIHPKSQIAKHCNGNLPCFTYFKPEEMALKINQFVNDY